MNEEIKKKYTLMLKNLLEKNEELKKYIETITPMFNTEIKFYPIGLKIEDDQNTLIELTTTSIHCLNCCHQFEWLPTFLPISYNNGTFTKMGSKNSIIFCSFNCASSYNLNIYKTIIKSIDDINISCALPKELLSIFGGPLTIEEYRLKSKIIEKEYHKFIPPFVPSNYLIEEVTKFDKSINSSFMVNNHPNSLKNTKFLKRKKNLETSQQSIKIEDAEDID